MKPGGLLAKTCRTFPGEAGPIFPAAIDDRLPLGSGTLTPTFDLGQLHHGSGNRDLSKTR